MKNISKELTDIWNEIYDLEAVRKELDKELNNNEATCGKLRSMINQLSEKLETEEILLKLVNGNTNKLSRYYHIKANEIRHEINEFQAKTSEIKTEIRKVNLKIKLLTREVDKVRYESTYHPKPMAPQKVGTPRGLKKTRRF